MFHLYTWLLYFRVMFSVIQFPEDNHDDWRVESGCRPGFLDVWLCKYFLVSYLPALLRIHLILMWMWIRILTLDLHLKKWIWTWIHFSSIVTEFVNKAEFSNFLSYFVRLLLRKNLMNHSYFHLSDLVPDLGGGVDNTVMMGC